MYIQLLLSAQLTPLRQCLQQQTIATCKCKRQREQLVFPEGDCKRLKSRDRSSLRSVDRSQYPTKQEPATLVLVVCTHPCSNL